MLSFSDDSSTTYFKWVNNTRTALPARLEHFRNQGYPLSHFSQQDVDQGLVTVLHLGQPSEDPFPLHYHATDKEGALVAFNMTVQPYLGVLSVVRNTGLEVQYQQSAVMSSSQLTSQTSFGDQRPTPPVTYVVHRHPANGLLVLSTGNGVVEGADVESFSQTDVDMNRLSFRHTSNAPISHDSFEFSLASGLFNPPQRWVFNISISLPSVSVRPRITVSTTPFFIVEGALKQLPPQLITISLEPASASQGPFEIIITTPQRQRHVTILNNFRPTNKFRLLDLQGGAVKFVHDDSEFVQVLISFCVAAVGLWPPDVRPPNESCGHTLMMNVIQRNDVKPKVRRYSCPYFLASCTFHSRSLLGKYHKVNECERKLHHVCEAWHFPMRYFAMIVRIQCSYLLLLALFFLLCSLHTCLRK